jgi:uncharacterized protein YggE
VLVSFCSLMLIASAARAQPPQPPPQGPPVVVTTGEAVVKRAPDRAWVTIAAESRAKTPVEAQKLNADAMASVMQKLKGLGIGGDAVKTTSYNLQPEFDFNNGRRTLRGYLARNAIEVRVDDLAKTGAVLDAAVSAGATNVSGVRFDLKDRAAVEREALSQAVADARARATAAASGAGVAVDRILRIEEQRASVPEPYPVMRTMAAGAAAAAEPPIAPGEVEIRVSVTMTSAIK